MIRYYCWNTQNARKAAIFLAEAKMDHEIVPVNLFDNEHKREEYTAICPNGRIPALVDTEVVDENGRSLAIFESGCILVYLGEKTQLFLPVDPAKKFEVLQWVFWQMSGLGPTLGQLAHFAAPMNLESPSVNALLKHYCAEDVHAYPLERFMNESIRLLGVLETALEGKAFIAGEYSIADMAIFPWIESAWSSFKAANPEIDGDFKNIVQWMERISARSAVGQVLKDYAWENDAMFR